MPHFDQIMPIAPKRFRMRNGRVVALVYEGLCAFEFACAAEVFGLPRPELEPDWYRFETCALERRSIRGQYGMRIEADGGMDRLVQAGTVIVPGWRGIDTPVPAPLIEALREAHRRGARLLSICSGAFVLAATGLLDGKRATTHWRYVDALRSKYPLIDVNPDVLYIDEGGLLTSAGSASGLDLCLHLVRRDWGPDIANQVARRLVIPPHRDGGQAQFVERPVQNRERNALSPLLDRMRQHLNEAFTVPDMAKMVAMSERTFIRRFKETTGTTPADWLVMARVDQARALLEQSPVPVEEIASQCGFGSATTMRHHFRRKVGVSPNVYRARFSNAPA
jgi:AraC family transcriptional activator FtrA